MGDNELPPSTNDIDADLVEELLQNGDGFINDVWRTRTQLFGEDDCTLQSLFADTLAIMNSVTEPVPLECFVDLFDKHQIITGDYNKVVKEQKGQNLPHEMCGFYP